jgi:hypothetical protein
MDVGGVNRPSAVLWSDVVRPAARQPCRAPILNMRRPVASPESALRLSQLLAKHAGAPLVPTHSPEPNLYAVTTEKGLVKLRGHLAPSATIHVTPFELNEELLLVQIVDTTDYDPVSIMDLMERAHITCVCGRPESAAGKPGLVYSQKGSALAESRGTLTVGVPTLRVRPDGTREFATEWATQLWMQKALRTLQPAAAALNPHGHLLMVPAPGQSVATLQQRAEEAGLAIIAIRLPAAAAFVARMILPAGTPTVEIGGLQWATEAQLATRGLQAIGRWSCIGPGETIIQLLLDPGAQQVDQPQIHRVGAAGLVAISRKGEKNPWQDPPASPEPAPVPVKPPSVPGSGPVPKAARERSKLVRKGEDTIRTILTGTPWDQAQDMVLSTFQANEYGWASGVIKWLARRETVQSLMLSLAEKVTPKEAGELFDVLKSGLASTGEAILDAEKWADLTGGAGKPPPDANDAHGESADPDDHDDVVMTSPRDTLVTKAEDLIADLLAEAPWDQSLDAVLSTFQASAHDWTEADLDTLAQCKSVEPLMLSIAAKVTKKEALELFDLVEKGLAVRNEKVRNAARWAVICGRSRTPPSR